MAVPHTPRGRIAKTTQAPDGRPEPASTHQAPIAAEASIADSMQGFCDPDWYAREYPDVAAAGLDPLRHFIQHGAAERRNPNGFFDGAWYVRHYPDIAAAGVLPLLHYLQAGAAELRNPHPRFDAAWYVDQHPESAANPLVYHMRVGRHRGYATEPTLDIRDWLPSAEAPFRVPRDLAVDIVIPAYRGLAETQRCLRSVLADLDRPRGRVIVIDDKSPEPALSAWLDTQAREGTITLLRNRRNLGFVASANHGLRAADAGHDVVLLNSDTEVPSGWLTRLGAQAWSRPRVASVSPFSNNATICSYPRDHGWEMPFGLTVAELDEVCRAVNAGRSVPVPTTVGFCMYIRRDALNDVGLLDEQAFGHGYGEENDFCMRASQRGWQHLLACDTFVYHEGSVSFGDEVGPRSASGQTVLAQRYPDYRMIIDRHVRSDEVGSRRFAVTAALFRRSGLPVILLVCHDLGGGVLRHIDLLVERMAGRAHFLLLGATQRGVALSVPAIPGHPTLVLPQERVDDLMQVLRLAAVRRVHIHHLAGVDLDIRALIHRLGVPFDVTVHDYYAICPQVTLLPWTEGVYCGEPGPALCNACIAERSSHGAREILSWRREHAWQFVEAERVICPSADVRDRLISHGLGDRAIVAPHDPVPSEPWSVRGTKPSGRKLTVAVIGVLANHKGAHVVASVATQAERAGIELRLIGYPETGFPEEFRPLLKETGQYEEKDLPALLASARPHVVWFPAPWPETYSYTLSAALAAELPVVATRIGSFPERLANRPLTWLVDPTQSTEAWLGVFAEVRETLRKAPAVVTGPLRPDAPDFYAADYLDPPRTRAITGRGPALTDLRREGRTSVVLIPERIGDGLLSPCAYIRLLLPLDHPDIGGDMDVIIADVDTALHYRADIIATQRYAIRTETQAEALLRHAKATGAALLYEMDDDLLNIPPTHADAAELRPRAGIVRLLVKQADHVWVSTDSLAARIRAVRPKVTVVPNGLDERLWLRRTQAPRREFGPVRILYMGTATHAADFAIIAPALERLKRDFSFHVEIDILGVTGEALPAGITRIGPSINGGQSYPGFVNWITSAPAWDIGLVPLADSAFNRSKSVIKTLDYAALGLAVLASDMPVYRGSLADGPGGMLVANDPDDWYAAISLLVRDRALGQRLARGAVDALVATGTLASQAAARRAAWQTVIATSAAPAAATRPRTSRRVKV
jgi:GT2 family glycosyltransferase/glycosyltransferase involved in cell wall biosynthesis